MLDTIGAIELVNYIRDSANNDKNISISTIRTYATWYLTEYSSKGDYVDDIFSQETIAYVYCKLINAIE